MDSKDSLSHSNLYNLETLINYQLPAYDDDFDCHIKDESSGCQGRASGKQDTHTTVLGRKSESTSSKRKRRTYDNNGADENGILEMHITEDHYRAMLGEHIQNYINFKQISSNPELNRTGIPPPRAKRSSSKAHESVFEHQENTVFYEPSYLDIGDGVTYMIPPSYDNQAILLNLPSFSDIVAEECQLKGTLDLASFAKLMANSKRFEPRNGSGMGEPKPKFESLQDRLNSCNSAQKFFLEVSEIPSVPKGAAGNIKRSILSRAGVLQVHYVKVLEKGDTYEIIERSLPKRPKLIKDPSLIEREETEKIGKAWAGTVRRDIPKYHKIFTSLQRKHLINARRVAESCQRKVKHSGSLKFMSAATIRARKLSREVLLLWKRKDKEMAEVKKREDREALRREQELREAKRQHHRLNFLIQQTELYSHLMQNKQNSHPSDVEALSPSDSEIEDAIMKKEALKAAQDAVSKQKRLTSDFDTECMRLRQAGDMEIPSSDTLVAGSSNIDLQTPSTMPVTSTVQTPELFKGSLKEYQLKGLQWLLTVMNRA